ncbi:MAG TPA: hypothetical protein VGA16_10200 [Candidatus Limnocylindria bacterium]
MSTGVVSASLAIALATVVVAGSAFNGSAVEIRSASAVAQDVTPAAAPASARASETATAAVAAVNSDETVATGIGVSVRQLASERGSSAAAVLAELIRFNEVEDTSTSGVRPGWGCGDKNHTHSGPPGNPGATSPCK